MEVNIPNVPGHINNGPEDFVLKSLDYSYTEIKVVQSKRDQYRIMQC